MKAIQAEVPEHFPYRPVGLPLGHVSHLAQLVRNALVCLRLEQANRCSPLLDLFAYLGFFRRRVGPGRLFYAAGIGLHGRPPSLEDRSSGRPFPVRVGWILLLFRNSALDLLGGGIDW